MNVVIRLANPSDALNMAEVHMRSWEVAYKDIIPADYIREKNAPCANKNSLCARNYAIDSFSYLFDLRGT